MLKSYEKVTIALLDSVKRQARYGVCILSLKTSKYAVKRSTVVAKLKAKYE